MLGQRSLDYIKVEDIDLGSRFRKDYGDLKELSDDFKVRGVIQPIAVLEKRFMVKTDINTELDSTKPYLLLAGGRRTFGAKAARLEEIPAIIYQHEVTELELRVVELHENIKRKAMTTLEEAASKLEIHNLMVKIHGEHSGATRGKLVDVGWSETKTAELIGESPKNVSRDLRLAEAMIEHPQLAKARNKSEANKMLQNIIKDEARRELAKRMNGKKAEKPIDIARKDIASRYITGSFFECADKLKDRTIDFFEIDPPYAKDLVNLIGDDRDTARHYVEVEESDDEPLDVVYHAFMKQTFDLAYKKMKDHSWGICWYAMNPWHQYIIDWLEEAGFTVRHVPMLWIKNHGRTRNVNLNLPDCYENFLYFRKGTPSLAKPGSRNWLDHPVPSQAQRTHPAERPIELYEDLLSIFCRPGASIAVPFAGSGNTILGADNLKMSAVGWDIVEQYKSDFDFKVYRGEPGKYKTLV